MAEQQQQQQQTGEMPQTQEPNVETQPGTGQPAPQATPAMTLEQAMAELTKVRVELKARNNEEAARRKKLEALEAEEEKRKQAEMTEVQKWQVKAQEYEAKVARYEADMQALRLRNAVEREAGAMGFYKPIEAYKLLDFAGVAFGDDGEPDKAQIQAALDALKKDSPHLVKPTTTPAGQAPIGATEGRAVPSQPTVPDEAETRKRYRL